MVKILPITLNETIRWRLSSSLGIINFISIIAALVLIGLGVYVRVRLYEYMHLMADYNLGTLPITIIVAGVLSLVLNVLSGLLFLFNNHPDNRRKIRVLFYVHLIIALFVCTFVLAAGLSCYTHVTHLNEAFHGGLTSSMAKYRQGRHQKQVIDQLQMSYKCCGSMKYTDWFRTDWIPDVYYKDFAVNVEVQTGTDGNGVPHVDHDHVPFSCCSTESVRPCIHKDVHNNEAHTQYDYSKDLTLNTIGCKDALMNFFGDEILADAGACIVTLFFVQLLLIIVGRYLQTSVNTALLRGAGHEEDSTQGYLFKFREPPEFGTAYKYEAVETTQEPESPERRRSHQRTTSSHRPPSAKPSKVPARPSKAPTRPKAGPIRPAPPSKGVAAAPPVVPEMSPKRVKSKGVQQALPPGVPPPPPPPPVPQLPGSQSLPPGVPPAPPPPPIPPMPNKATAEKMGFKKQPPPNIAALPPPRPSPQTLFKRAFPTNFPPPPAALRDTGDSDEDSEDAWENESNENNHHSKHRKNTVRERLSVHSDIFEDDDYYSDE